MLQKLEAYFHDHPHVKGLSLEQVVELTGYDPQLSRNLVRYMQTAGTLVRHDELIALPGRELALKGVIKQAYDEIMKELKNSPFTPPALSELAGRGKVHQQAIKYIMDSGEGYKCGSAFVFVKESWDQIVAYVRDALNVNGKLEVARLRDRFGITRKYAIPILEELDRIGLTERQGDIRIKGPIFEK